MLIPQDVTKESGFVGRDCAFCKEPFAPGQALVVCPIDGSLHHTFCWEENGNHCTSLGCHGHGRLSGDEEPLPEFDDDDLLEDEDDGYERISAEPESTQSPQREDPAAQSEPDPAPSSAEQTPPIHFRFAQSCLMFAIAIAIIVMAFSCFGLWAILDYIMIDLLDYGYR